MSQTNDIVGRMIRVETEVNAHDLRLKRIESDIESEKGTRNRVTNDLEKRLRAVERSVWIGTGLMIGANILLKLL